MAKRTLIIYPILFAITLVIATLGFTRLVQTHCPPYLVPLKYYVLFFVVAKVLKRQLDFQSRVGSRVRCRKCRTLLITKNHTVLYYVTAFFRPFIIQGIINFTLGMAAYATNLFNTFDFAGLSRTQSILDFPWLWRLSNLFSSHPFYTAHHDFPLGKRMWEFLFVTA